MQSFDIVKFLPITGKIFGTKNNYLVVEAEYQEGEGEEEEEEEQNEGVYIYNYRVGWLPMAGAVSRIFCFADEVANEEGGEEEEDEEGEEGEGGEKMKPPPKSTWKPPPTVPSERPKAGVNRKTYFVCNQRK